MFIVGNGGPIDITASPQIVAGTDGDILTLTGTSDTNTVKLEDTAAVAMKYGYPITLGDGDSITFVYNTFDDSDGGVIDGWGNSKWGSDYGYGGTTAAWVETSRTKEVF